jgi:hypothetical protein
MHHKRHTLELLDLFKQSRQNARTQALAEPAPADPAPIREEVTVEGFGPLASDGTPPAAPSTSYLPKVTPMQKKTPSTIAIGKDTVVVGTVFLVVFVGLSFLWGRKTGMLSTSPPTPEKASQAVSLALVDEPALFEEPAAAEAESEVFVPQAPAPKGPAPAPAPAAKEEPQEQSHTHQYQVATTFDDQKSAEEYREFLIGNGYKALTYKTSKNNWWTVRVKSNDETEADLKKIRQLSFRGRTPFEGAWRLRN